MPAGADQLLRRTALDRCRELFPSWRTLTIDDVDFDDPKGFSSFTMAIRPTTPVDPPAVLYRGLAGKENAILDFDRERDVFLLLGDHHIAARCHHYDKTCRLEQFYRGRTLTADDVLDTRYQRQIANELYRLHQVEPADLPDATFFELLHEQWGEMARSVLTEKRGAFPPEEQVLCDDLTDIYSPATAENVQSCLPDRPPVFCHNDTYHGNVMLLDDGSIKLLDFEFSCRNHIAFDFANLFAETVMRHGDAAPPHFHIAEPTYTDADLALIVGFYLDNVEFPTDGEREAELSRLVEETRRAVKLSDYMYAMAALPLALEPIQRIRFLPYAHQRFHRFIAAVETG